MKYSKLLDKKERNRLYSIYVYFRYFKIESFEKFCYYMLKKIEKENQIKNRIN